MTRPSTQRYDALSLAFHWTTALAVAIAYVLGPGGFGRLMRQGIDPATRSGIVWHESLGVLVLGLTLLRLAWLAWRPSPPRHDASPWAARAARAVHLALWALLLALPLTALLALGTEGHPLTLLGAVRVEPVPLLAPAALAHRVDWGEVHEALGNALITLAGVHAVAALFHHLVLKDRVLTSMWPWAARR
jgi:cytochrome b561